MAGGIDWFRWHHGSVTDPKFQLVARRAGTSLPNVLAVWAYVLEKASASEFRGEFGDLDFEAIDCLYGMDDGTTAAILDHMQARDLIDHNSVKAWEKRQPKREDETANDRKRRQREREHEERIASAVNQSQEAGVTHDMSRNVTQGHAHVTPGHARGEERREEVNTSTSLRSVESAPEPKKPRTPRQPPPIPQPCPEDVEPQVWSDWLELRSKKKAPVTQTVIETARKEAEKAALSLEGFLRIWCVRGSQGLDASWIKPAERASPATGETNYQRSMREKYEQVCPAIAAKPPGAYPAPVVFDFEVIDASKATPARLG